MKDLFICSAGRRRSPLAASIAKRMASQSGIKSYHADYSGIDFIINNPHLLKNYSRVFVMDDLIEREFSDVDKIFIREIINLNVKDLNAADFYTIGESKLMEILREEIEEKLKPYFYRKR